MNPERRHPYLGRAFHRFPRRCRKTENCNFASLSIALPRGKDCRRVLVHMRSRFQRFAAMSTVGNLASPCHVQCPDAERAAARPFVAAFRTCTENKLRAAQEFVAFAKRDQESAVPVCTDQEFFQDRIPLAIGRFQNGERTGGQPGIWEPASNSWLVSTDQVHTNQSVAPCNWGISARRKITRIEQA